MPRAQRPAAVLIAAAVVAVSVAGCSPTTPSNGATSKAPFAAETSKPTPSPTSTSASLLAATLSDYLLAGTPYQPDANGEWSGHYGFWTDATHAVACDVTIFSGDSGGVSCAITPGHGSQRSYTLPSGVPTACDASSANAADGTAVAINYKVFDGDKNVGFSGCLSQYDASFDAARKILPPNTVLQVSQKGFETYTCTVASDQASCADSKPGSSFVFGLTTASFTQG